jgi:transcriptional regulator with XRE-family HTH domain
VNNTKEICKDIGEHLKELRVKHGYSSYENFAVEHDLSRMQYWRIEKGLTNLTIRSLVNILNIHKVSLEDFFMNLDAQSSDNKGTKSKGKGYKAHSKTKKPTSAKRKKK